MPVVAQLRPNITEQHAFELDENLYGLKVTVAKSLPSERDQNFYIKDNSDKEYVLKIAGSGDGIDALDMQNKAMIHLADSIGDFDFPRVCKTKSGEQIATVIAANGHRFFVRLL